MKWLMIENPGVAPVESFTILGVSTARGDSSKIGQFGSGAKHGVLVLLRHRLNPIIYFGRDKMEFLTKPKMMGDSRTFEQVCYTLNDGAIKELSWSTEFGELDWKHPNMALREFLSNALDQSTFIDVNIEIVDNPRAKNGYTRVFVPYTPIVQQWYADLGAWFLHYGGKQDERILSKPKPSPVKVYRKGVFIRELTGRHSGLYDYNFGEELQIDESRNLHDYAVFEAVGRAVTSDISSVRNILSVLPTKEKYFETVLPEYSLKATNLIRQAWNDEFGENTLLAKGKMFADYAEKKGHQAVVIENEAWYNTLKKAGVIEASQVLGQLFSRGVEEVPVTDIAQANLDKVWEGLEFLSLTNGKEKPQVKCFVSIMDGGAKLRGFQEKETVYINIENDDDKKVMLEEVAHYVTGATDLVRDFQDYAFLVASKAMFG